MASLLYIPTSKTVRINPDLSRRPVQIELPRNKRPATITLALISIWGAVGTVGLFHGLARLSTNTDLPVMTSLTLAFLVTLIAVVIGVLAMRHYVINNTILLYDDHIELTAYTLFGKRKWSAPHSDFEGFAAREITSSDEPDQKPYQLIELVHTNRENSLPVYLEKAAHPPSGMIDDLADRFDMPILRTSL